MVSGFQIALNPIGYGSWVVCTWFETFYWDLEDGGDFSIRQEDKKQHFLSSEKREAGPTRDRDPPP